MENENHVSEAHCVIILFSRPPAPCYIRASTSATYQSLKMIFKLFFIEKEEKPSLMPPASLAG